MAAALPIGRYMHDAYELFVQHKQGILACAIPSAAVLGWLWYERSNRGLPPGPRLLLFGKFFQPKTEEDVMNNCLKLSEEFGEVVSARFASNVYVILNSYQAIKEAYVESGDSVAGRPNFKYGTRLDDESSPGLINSDGPVWQEHRRFVLSTLRDFGFGKRTTEAMILEELQQLCKFFEESGQGGKQAVDVSLAFSKASTNVICSLVFGERCGTEKEFEEIMALLRKTREGSNMPFYVMVLVKLLMLLPGDPFKFKQAFSSVDRMIDYVESKINAHREKHTEGNDTDVIDAYLTIQAQREREQPGKHSFNDFQLARIIFELFIAGSDTTASMLRWIFYLMATHPDLQRKVQQEIDDVIGQRAPSASDRSQLKFTDAILHEIHRYAVMLPLGAPMHRVVNEVYVRGYRLPKDSVVFTNLYSVFRDAKVWAYPNELNPANFYDEQSKTLRNVDRVIPFLIGRRACPGESLAKQELFLFFVGLLQRFSFTLDQSFSSSEKTSINLFFRTTPPYRLIVTNRI